ncbi:MAG: DM13 domain-containing protein [Phycisphaerales bacterium JB064]
MQRRTIQTVTAAILATACAAPALAQAPAAGWTAELSTLSHGVRGTVIVVDEDTIRIDDFFFDGRGLDVRVYLGVDEDSFRSGIAVGPQLLGMPFAGGSLTIDLPAGETIDGWHAVSIWCVDVPVSFGQGTFMAPPCRVDMDGDGELTIFDFLAFQNAFDAGEDMADFDGDGELTIFDFLAFQNEFDAGC